MLFLSDSSLRAQRAGVPWTAQTGPGHPIVAAALCLALAVGVWYGLLWHFREAGKGGATVAGRVAPAQAADTQPEQETRRVVLAPPTPSSPAAREPVAPRKPPGPATSKGLSDSAPKLSSEPAPKVSSEPKVTIDSVPEPAPPRSRVSPFRRSHPWAASSGGRYYYPSSCPATLQLPDLVFFRSEAEARDRGFTPSRLPGCE